MVTIVLFKEKNNEWWSQIAIGEPEIDLKKVEPESSKLSDLDDDTRQMTEKLMVCVLLLQSHDLAVRSWFLYVCIVQFDDQQRAKGLPTSQEIEQAEMIRKFKEQFPQYADGAMGSSGAV